MDYKNECARKIQRKWRWYQQTRFRMQAIRSAHVGVM